MVDSKAWNTEELKDHLRQQFKALTFVYDSSSEHPQKYPSEVVEEFYAGSKAFKY